MAVHRRNWAKNFKYHSARRYRPESIARLQRIVAAGVEVRAVGTRHSFNAIADTYGDHVFTQGLPQTLEIDAVRGTATVAGAVRYGDLANALERRGLALTNMASLPHISVAGAVSTATHGSGVGNGNLATDVVGLEFVGADGSLIELQEGNGDFAGAVVGLGALGVVTRLTLKLRPSYRLHQSVFLDLPLPDALENFEEIMSSAYSVSMFTQWREDRIDQVWVKSLDPSPAEFFGARSASRRMHPIATMPAGNCTDQLGVPGPWHERLPHFRMEFTPSSGKELQSEYLVPMENAVDAFKAIHRLRAEIVPLLQTSEIRTIAADELWMSPCYRQPCAGIHFTWKPLVDEVLALLSKLDGTVEKFGARPHWGKLIAMPPEQIAGGFARLNDFLTLARRYDPDFKFWNPFLRRHLAEDGRPDKAE